MHDHLRRRLWSAQAGVLLPFAYRILRSLIRRHKEFLAKKVSPQHPYMKKYGSREVPVTDYWKLEFFDFQQLTENILSPEEAELRRVAHAVRNKVAHPDLVKPDQITKRTAT